eukprot:5628191-Amphidinium_carterae.1
MVKIGKHYYIHSVAMDGFINKVQISRSQVNAAFPKESFNGICGSDILSHEEDSDMQHADDVARSFDVFGPENQPGHSVEGTHQSSTEAAQPVTLPAPQEPSAAERERAAQSHSYAIQKLV